MYLHDKCVYFKIIYGYFFVLNNNSINYTKITQIMIPDN